MAETRNALGSLITDIADDTAVAPAAWPLSEAKAAVSVPSRHCSDPKAEGRGGFEEVLAADLNSKSPDLWVSRSQRVQLSDGFNGDAGAVPSRT